MKITIRPCLIFLAAVALFASSIAHASPIVSLSPSSTSSQSGQSMLVDVLISCVSKSSFILLMAGLLVYGVTIRATASRRRVSHVKENTMHTRLSLYSALAAALALPFAAAQADPIVNFIPNDFTGTVRFDNVPGSAVDIILTSDFGMNAAAVNANSITLPSFAGYNLTSSSPQVAPTTGRPYTVSTESNGGPGGPGFVDYNLSAYASFGTYAVGKFFNQFFFDGPNPSNPNTVTANAPATVVNFHECVGIVKVQFDSNSCTSPATPIPLGDSYIFSPGSYTYTQGPTSAMSHIAKPKAGPQNFTLHYNLGSDPYSDLIQNETNFQETVSCDVVNKGDGKPVCLGTAELPGTGGGGGGGLGKIIGKENVVGELENANNQRTLISADSGPFGNYRWDNIGGEIGSPNPPFFPGPPETPRSFELENLVPGNYSVYGQTTARLGSKYVFMQTDRIPAASVANQITDLGNTFVMNPGFFYGDILLTHFPPASAGGFPASGLNDLYFAYTNNVNGVPTDLTLSSGSLLAVQSGDAYSNTAWPFDPATGNTGYGQTESGVLRSNYDLPVVLANNVAGTWPSSGRTRFALRFNGALGSTPRPNGYLYTDEAATPQVLNLGQKREIDYAYCYGNVTVDYLTTAGTTLYNPIAAVSGGFVGTLTAIDPATNQTLFSRSADYLVSGNFIGIPQSFANKDIKGKVAMTLPQGTYTLTPTIQAVNAQGNVSTSQFAPTTFTLEKCNDEIKIEVGNSPSCDTDRDGDIDKLDLSAISKARSQVPLPGDPRDANLDGKIDARDVKVCIPKCTRAQCATQ